jgi:DNA-binding NarL/FixJ family response regulator/anti-sigma regulatory factor (Ser/Thr protein kinase)
MMLLPAPMIFGQFNPLPKKVLLVGSDELVANTVSRVLSDWKLVRASDNQEAFSLVKKKSFDLVITGEQSTGKEDVELLRKIRQVWPHTRLIILTDESTPADVIAAIRSRAFSYFSKPYTQEALAEMLRLVTETPVWDEGIELISATPAWIYLAARCDLNTANRLIQFIHEVGDLPHPEAAEVGLAFREMLMNAIEYGGHFDPSRHVEISYVRARHMIMCRIKDPGEGFSLRESAHAATSNPPDNPMEHLKYREAEGMRPGGYGVMMAKKLVDELIYGEKGNDVLLIKYLGSAHSNQSANLQNNKRD